MKIIHCFMHCLNLYVEDNFYHHPFLKEIFYKTKRIIVAFTQSPKKTEIFRKKQIKHITNDMNIEDKV
jgi:hypothetical protein